jgi:hypothetical protein
MANRRTLLTTIGTIGTVAIAGCGGTQEGEVDTDNDGNGNNDEATVEVHSQELFEDSIGDAGIRGEATNRLGSEETIIFEGTFYNSDDTIIADGIESFHEEIPDGQRFQFEVTSLAEYGNVADYDLEWSTL